MATYTDKLSLKKPAGTDPFLLTDFNSNWDELDKSPGVWVCTSSSRPAGWGVDEAGRMILETNTKKMFIWPGSGSFVEVVNTTAASANTTALAAQSTANAAYALASGGSGGGANDSVARAAAVAAQDTADEALADTTILLSLRTKVYQYEPMTYVAANQTTWGPAPITVGTTFTTPPSGAVAIQVSAKMKALSATTSVSYRIRTGSILGSGAEVDVPASSLYGIRGIEINGADGVNPVLGHFSGPLNLHLLTPNTPYNVVFLHYNNHVVTAEVNWRSISITPQPSI